MFGHMKDIIKDEAGATWREWADDIPHNGMFKFLGLFDEDRLVVVRYRTSYRCL